MSELEVRIVQLEPMRVASVHGFGQSPELQAWEKLVAWAGPKGLLDDPETHRIFGFNNPNPSSGSPNYGYEFWIVVGPEAVPEGEVRIKEFAGGQYAVTRCQGAGTITETWHRLGMWCEDSPYEYADRQCLEKLIGPAAMPLDEETLTLDLYLPIAG